MIYIYRIIYFIIFCIVKLLSPFLPKKIKNIIDLRNQSIDISFDRPFWIHAASGEFEYAKPLIRELKKKYPNKKIIVSYYSVSYKAAIQKNSEIDFSFALPWDFAATQNKLLKKINPEIIFIARTDLWSEFLFQAKKLQIKTYLFSYYANQKSAKFKWPLLFFTKWQLNLLSFIDCASSDDYDYLKQLSINANLHQNGDTRYDQVFYRLNQPNPNIKNAFLNEIVFICGSTWKEDEDIIIPAYKKLSSKFKLLIAPHEIDPHHMTELKNKLASMQLSFDLYSELKGPSQKQVVVVDQTGILAELYKQAHFAFVGGSFKQKVHSVMEPLAANLRVLVGPHYHNNLEAVQYSKGLDPIVITCDKSNFESKLQYIYDWYTKNKNNIHISNVIQNKSGATKAISEYI